MSAPVISLNEQLIDQRSNQIAYKVSIEASKDYSFRLTEMEPRIPKGSRLVEVIDTSMAEIDSRRKELIEDLNSITKNIIWVSSEDFREKWTQTQKESFKEILTFVGFFRVYSEILFPFLYSDNTMFRRMEREFRKMSFNIYSVSDAQKAHDLWIKNLNSDDNVKKLYGAKFSQLKQIEQKAGKVEDASLADVDSSTPFSATYVVQFKRGWLEARKYQIGFDIEYTDSVYVNARATNVSSTVQISPSPVALSLVAIFSAVLGTTVKLLLSSNISILNVGTTLDSAQMLVGPIVALIFFNIYEQTSVGRGLSLSVNWRSAMLIGALCGIAHERILEALKALIGA